MATIVDSLKQSSINIQNISKSLSATKGSLGSVNESVTGISKIIAKNTRIKQELLARSSILNARRQEASRRQELEDEVEASRPSTNPSRAYSFAGKSTTGVLGRLLQFLGFISAGWIVENLPTWIFMGNEFVRRVKTFGKSMYNMVDDMQFVIQTFGKLLKDSFTSIIHLDLDAFASDGIVGQSFNDLNLAVQGLGDDISDTFKLFTTSLNESLETGEKGPGLGETREESNPPSVYVPETTQLGASSEVTGIHKQALDIISGPESGGSYNAMNQGTIGKRIVGSTGNSRTKIGKELTSMTIGEVMKRQAYLMNKGNPQISNYGIYAAGRYQIIPGTMEAAVKNAGLKSSDMFSPENQDKLGLAVLKSQGIGAWTVGGSRYTAAQTAIINKAKNTPVSYAPLTSSAKPSSEPSQPKPILVTSGFGWRWGRKHLGVDLAPKTGKVEGTPVVIKKGGIVVYANITKGNMGQILITHDDGTQSRYLHVNNFQVKAGQRVNAGQTIAYLAAMGSPGIGNATGPHLHFEYYSSTTAGPSDPSRLYQNYVSLGGKSSGFPVNPLDPNQQSRSPGSAQISSRPRSQQPSELASERKGSQVIMIDNTPSQSSNPVYVPESSSSPSQSITEFSLLNSFTKNRFLTSLAYL